jgi:peptidoglycan hydrolase-like amidase
VRSFRPAAALAPLVAVVVAAALRAAAPASADQRWSVPDRAWITIKGHGYGHGHGMSQHGAQGAALQGKGHRGILGFYYPGTRRGEIGGQVKVLITADTSDDLVVRARSGLTVRDSTGGGKVRLPDNGASRWRVAVTGTGVNRVSYRTDRWRTWRNLKGWGEFAAAGAPVTLVTPSGQRAYRGRLRAVPVSAGSRARDTVNVTSLENYVKGVVPLEMPATWSPAAVRAQAVAARTYAAYERASKGQICDTTQCQVYGGASAEHPASNRAVNATRRELRKHRGAPAFTQLSARSGGWTSAGSAPYLPAQKDPYDGWSGNPHHTWSVRVTDRRIEQAFPAIGNLRRIVVQLPNAAAFLVVFFGLQRIGAVPVLALVRPGEPSLEDLGHRLAVTFRGPYVDRAERERQEIPLARTVLQLPVAELATSPDRDVPGPDSAERERCDSGIGT